MDIHGRIKLARVLAGLSQSELAEFMDCSQSAIARYEVDRIPASDSVFVALSRSTGFPVDWLKEGALKGLVVCRVERPGVDYPPFAKRFAENTINKLLPGLIPPETKLKILRATSKYSEVFVAFSPTFCLVLFARLLAPTLRNVFFPHDNQRLSGHSEDITELDDHVFWNAYIQPEYDYLRDILACAGANDWREKVYLGKFQDDELEVIMNIKFMFNGREYIESDLVQSAISTLVQALKSSGGQGIVTNTVVKRVGTKLDYWARVKNPEDISGAPNSWRFQAQSIILAASQETLQTEM